MNQEQTVAPVDRPESEPAWATLWRPYANPDIIAKEVSTPRGTAYFLIDPWTQRWVIAEQPVPSLLKLANGRRPFDHIAQALAADPAAAEPSQGFEALAQELRATGMLFDNQAQHRASGRPVYNRCEPVGMHLEVTNACNMTCTHCYVSSGRKLSGELSLEEVYKTIDLLPPFSGKRVAISGGEPAVRKDCAEIVEYCVRNGHAVDLYTNGRNFPRQLAERILAMNRTPPPPVRIQMSLEGAEAQTNDAVRGQGSFAKAMESLAMFKEVGVNRAVVLFVCLTKYNVGEVDDLIRLAESHDVAALVFSQWQRQGNAQNTPWAWIAPSTEEWVAIGEKLLKYRNPRLQVLGNFYGDLNNNPSGRYSLDGPLFPKHLYFYNAFPRVTPDGWVFADQLFVDHDWRLGNVRTDTFEECFESPKFHAQLEQMRKRTEHIAACQSCEWRKLCEGGSAGHTYAEYGHMNVRDWFCGSRIHWFNRFVAHQLEKALGRQAPAEGPPPVEEQV